MVEESDTKYSLDQVMTIASIIQAEAADKEDMYYISSILHNRLTADSSLGVSSSVLIQQSSIRTEALRMFPKMTEAPTRADMIHMTGRDFLTVLSATPVWTQSLPHSIRTARIITSSVMTARDRLITHQHLNSKTQIWSILKAMITNFEKPEILSPAGDMDCLKSALNFGADAVFLAGKMFGMRSAPQNFDNDQLKKACDLAHAKGARIHVTCNTLPRNNEIPHLQEFMENAQACGVDAFIIADLGVFEAAKKYAPKVQRHISTQAGVTNYAAANVLYNMGASRVVLAREIPLDEIAEMRAKVPKELEIECFVHGAMCVSFSGRCLISSYMTGRDANHGDWRSAVSLEVSSLRRKPSGTVFSC